MMRRWLNRARAAALCLAATIPAADADVGGIAISVDTTKELVRAVRNAAPGTTITLAPGVYRVRDTIALRSPGAPGAPIVIRAERLGDAVIEAATTETFNISAPHWVIKNLHIVGVCKKHSRCEHAFHIVGDADGIVIRGNRLVDFNAQIKGNGRKVKGVRAYPDDVTIEGNALYNTTVRNTSNPVTPIDVVGGNNWVIRDNVISDFAKGGGDKISYGAFLKGNSQNGVFERNVVACSWVHDGGVRVGMSFGGGGSGKAYCEGDCGQEHQGGIMRNNVIAFCSDVGIYLNRASDVAVHNNTLYKTLGIDVRFPQTTADVRNNVMTGAIDERNDGRYEGSANLLFDEDDFAARFADPEGLDFRLRDGDGITGQADVAAFGVVDDLCGRARPPTGFDIGAFEYGDGEPCSIRDRLPAR